MLGKVAGQLRRKATAVMAPDICGRHDGTSGVCVFAHKHGVGKMAKEISMGRGSAEKAVLSQGQGEFT